MGRKKGLRPEAYQEIPGSEYIPYVSPEETPSEFTLKALILGGILGCVFGAANAYLGLRIGLTISTSIPVAVLTVATFRILRPLTGVGTILESNLSQTVGSASSSLASGIIFTIPALFLWGLDPTYLQLAWIGLSGGLLGVLFMVPLRRFLIRGEHGRLPYPEGTACAEVLVAGEIGGSRSRNVFLGLGVGAVLRFMVKGLQLWKEEFHLRLPVPKKAELALDTAPALLGVGFILGYRISAIMVGGGLLASLVLIPLIAHFGENLADPLFPETVKRIAEMTAGEIWSRYIRYIGAGAVACGGIITLVRALPTILSSFRVGIHALRGRAAKVSETVRTDRDLPLGYVLGGVLLITVALAGIPHILGSTESVGIRLVGAIVVVLFAFFFVTVSSRIVGLVGVTSNPTSGMILTTLLATSLTFLLLGWTGDIGKVAAITIGGVVGIAASIAGDTSQDLKTGFLLGATPLRQQIGELIGVLTAIWVVAGTVFLLADQYGFGTQEIPAPQAMLMKLVVEGVLDRQIPWSLILIGAAIVAILELLSIPSLPLAVGIYLPIGTLTPIFVGGVLRRWIEFRTGKDSTLLEERRERGILFGSGLVGGDGIMGVGIALVAFLMGRRPEGFGDGWLGPLGSVFPLIAFIGLCVFLWWVTTSKLSSEESPQPD